MSEHSRKTQPKKRIQWQVQTVSAHLVNKLLREGLVFEIDSPGQYEIKIEDGELTVKPLEDE